MAKQAGRFRVTFADPPTSQGHGSGETGQLSRLENRPHGGGSSGSASSSDTNTLPSFAATEQQTGAKGHGGRVPMEESSMISNKNKNQNQNQNQKQKQKQKKHQQQQQPQPQPQQQAVIAPVAGVLLPQVQRFLVQLDGSPAEYETKFEKLHQESQKLVLEIQERIREYKDESQRVEEYVRLYDSSGSGCYFENDAVHFNQQLRGLSFAHRKEGTLAEELRDVSIKILRATDVAVRSYTELRNIFHQRSSARTLSVHASTQMAGATGTYSAANQPWPFPVPTASASYFRIARPSSFMLETVARFDQDLAKLSQQIVELEELVRLTSESSSSPESSLQSIPRTMSNVHDFFIHVAAKAEKLHQHLDAMKKAYCATSGVLR